MRIRLISVGQKMPRWVAEGFEAYARRLPPECALQLLEVPAGARRKGADLARLIDEEGRRMLAAIPEKSLVVALDVKGQLWDTPTLASRLGQWMAEGLNPCLLVGGPEGLAPACLARADLRWSLSPLTFPHPLVRVILAEQLYRAWSLLRGHPYHRE